MGRRRKEPAVGLPSETDGRAQGRESAKPEKRLKQVVEAYLEGHPDGWQQSLAKELGVSPGHLSGWLSGDRFIKRGDAVLLALKLMDQRYERLKKAKDENQAVETRKTFDKLLNDILSATGYPAVRGRRNTRFRSLADAFETTDDRGTLATPPRRRIRVGWAQMPGFAETVTATEKGFAFEVATLAALLMGHDIEPDEREWSQLVQALHRREIDLIAPVLMQLPSRMFRVGFSKPLPRVRVGFNGIVHVGEGEDRGLWNRLPSLLRRGVDLTEMQKNGFVPRALLPVHQDGGVGETLCPIYFRGVKPEQRENATTGYRFAMDNEDYEDKQVKYRRCFVADEATCLQLLRGNAKTDPGAHLLFEPTQAPIQLSVAFAAHPEEDELLRVVNYCIDVLDQSPIYEDIRDRFVGRSDTFKYRDSKPAEPGKTGGHEGT